MPGAVAMSLALVLSAGGSAVATARLAGAQTGSGAGFYPGKTLTFIAPGNPQSAAALWAREVAPLMARYLHARVDVFDDAAGEPFGGQAQLASSPSDGLTFGGLNLPQDFSLAISRAAPLPFKLDALKLVGVTGPAPNVVWCVSTTYSERSFAALIAGHRRVLVPDTTGDLDNVIIRSVNAIFGVNAHIISGYANAAEVVFGFERGDAPLAGASLSAFLPLIQAGKARPILLLSPVTGADAKRFAGVPTLEEFAAHHQLHSGSDREALAELLEIASSLSGNALAVPVGVPAARTAALSAAFRVAMSETEPGEAFLSGSSAANDYSQAIKHTSALTSFLPVP